MPRDANFNKKTRQIIAQRAGYRCSFPGCGRITIGPGEKAEDVEKTGHAAHILSASPSGSGPRGTGGKDAEARSSPQNGIWMCATHAGLIDENSGLRYPTSELMRWKALHEARIDHEHRKLPLPFGWLSKLEIATSPLFVPNTNIDFGKVTLLTGNNGTGKTAICELLAASCGHIDRACRWMPRRPDRGSFDFRLNYSNPDPGILRGKIEQGKIEFFLNGGPCLDLGHRFSIVFVESLWKNVSDLGKWDDLALIASGFGISRLRIAQVLPSISDLSLPFVNEYIIEDFYPEDDEDRSEISELSRDLFKSGIQHPQTLLFSIGCHKQPLPFRLLASRERSIAAMSTAIALAHVSALHLPTLLIFDLSANFLPNTLINAYANLLTEARFGFQSVFVSAREYPEIEWTGWSIARFSGAAPELKCDQTWWYE
ncbi:MAG: ATP-binding protein [Vulcanimicrobiota bacterium]